ncbi:hypothetical protein ZWY2020_016358 [Hordeum vulgare]|nr:hypothetical protein ZWY2020_016358 [Hordeum vulgare]
MASPAGDDDYDDRDLFAGVRFFLVGFDNVSESQDDPVCAAARAQGNMVVSELWVDDSLDRGFLADADRVIYWPTKDLNGIPGSDSLQICLTGYQRNDREDIMKMVSLMGAHFSKPLLGHVVTHLVCYKFEGEKYELAKSGNREEVAVRDLDNPNQAQPAEYKYVDEILTVPKNMATPIAMNAGANSASMEVDGSVVNNVNAEQACPADAWVQEFIRHDIPCKASADYLVEYVCKPGYPLDTHVLFKTSRLATKSLDKLLKSQQEVAMDNLEASEDDGDDDLSCAACGSTDRAEVMLICGSEDGTVGCGVGMHIDCCDPPLDHVPDDDWLCPKCEAPKAKKKPPRGAASKSRIIQAAEVILVLRLRTRLPVLSNRQKK